MTLEEKDLVAWICLHPAKQIVDIEAQTVEEYWQFERPRPMCRIRFDNPDQQLMFIARFLHECVGEDRQYAQAEIRGLPLFPGFHCQEMVYWRAPAGFRRGISAWDGIAVESLQ